MWYLVDSLSIFWERFSCHECQVAFCTILVSAISFDLLLSFYYHLFSNGNHQDRQTIIDWMCVDANKLCGSAQIQRSSTRPLHAHILGNCDALLSQRINCIVAYYNAVCLLGYKLSLLREQIFLFTVSVCFIGGLNSFRNRNNKSTDVSTAWAVLRLSIGWKLRNSVFAARHCLVWKL